MHQHITKTVEGDAKIVSLQVANQSNNDNLEILAQILQAEKDYCLQRDRALENWVRVRNQDTSEFKGDTTLTKIEVRRIQMEIDWEKARHKRIANKQ